jgi:hypothetical protein
MSPRMAGPLASTSNRLLSFPLVGSSASRAALPASCLLIPGKPSIAEVVVQSRLRFAS